MMMDTLRYAKLNRSAMFSSNSALEAFISLPPHLPAPWEYSLGIFLIFDSQDLPRLPPLLKPFPPGAARPSHALHTHSSSPHVLSPPHTHALPTLNTHLLRSGLLRRWGVPPLWAAGALLCGPECAPLRCPSWVSRDGRAGAFGKNWVCGVAAACVFGRHARRYTAPLSPGWPSRWGGHVPAASPRRPW